MRSTPSLPPRRSAAFTRTAAFVFVIALASAPAALAQDAHRVTLLGHIDSYSGYSACWSYVHTDGREYAILGTTTGTSIVNVTNPSAPYEVAFIPGLASAWREMKQYGTHLYVSTEAAGGGIQVIRMNDPDFPELVQTYTAAFNRAHTVAVDSTRALLICNGTRSGPVATGMRILSLADPENPVEVGSYTGDYVHDSWMRGDTLFAFCIASGTIRVFDSSSPASLNEIASWTYPGAVSHSGEASRDGRHLYVCDEVNSGRMRVFDITDLATHPLVHDTYVHDLAIAHNVHVQADTAYLAYYTEGVRLFDISDPALPCEWGHYDTYPGYSGGYHGVWEVAPFFPSGTFIASDIETGLYVFRADPDYGTLKVRVTNQGMAPLEGADITVIGGADSTQTQGSGAARLALDPGAHSIRVRAFGYVDAVLPVTIGRGTHDSIAVALVQAPAGPIQGSVHRATDLGALEGATVILKETPLAGTTDAAGSYALGGIPVGTYSIFCDRPGYVFETRMVTLGDASGLAEDFTLLPAAWYDDCDSDLGWSLSAAGDDATGGQWVRAVPVGTSIGAATTKPALPGTAPGIAGGGQHPEPGEGGSSAGPVQPSSDYTPGSDGSCFVTGNGLPGGAPGDADVDGGRTTLTTPPLDLTAMTDPVIGYRRWYYMSSPGEPDSFLVEISGDGLSWVRVAATRASHPEWHHETIRVRDFITPTATVRVRFIAQDEGPGGLVEAAVDDAEAHDAALVPTSIPVRERPAPPRAPVLLAARPNPARAQVLVTLSLPEPGRARVAIHDAAGQRVAVLFDGWADAGALGLRWNGQDGSGRPAASGVYWVRAEAGAARLARRVTWIR